MPAKGTTNNPNGRPPKSRALTDLLVKALAKRIETTEGKQVARKAILAELVADALATGRLKFPGDTEASVISVKDWLEFTKWAYQYLEPPITRQELTGAEGGEVVLKVVYDKKADNA